MKQQEHELIVRILDGDEQSYGVLIDRYKEGLYRHCFRFMRDEDGAEDVAQRAFIQAYVKLQDFDQIHAFSTWLYKIATNIALGEIRKKHPLPLGDDLLANLASNQVGTERQAIYNELYRAIEQLPESQKRAVKLHYFKGKKYEQIAKEMNTTPGSDRCCMSTGDPFWAAVSLQESQQAPCARLRSSSPAFHPTCSVIAVFAFCYFTKV